MHHISARESSDGVLLAQKNRLLRTDLLAHPAENAANHVNIEFLWIFFDFGEPVCRRNLAWNNFDRARRTDEFAQLTGNAAHTPVRIPHKRGRAPIMVRQAAVHFSSGYCIVILVRPSSIFVKCFRVMARPPTIAGKYMRSRQLSFGRATV